MAAGDGDALVCDFAQTYHILDWRALPAALAATLAAGLPEGSRSVRRLQGLKAPLETVLLAQIADRLAVWLWWHTGAGQAGRDRPEPVAPLLLAPQARRREEGVRVFATGADFLAAYNQAIGGEAQ
jgi:hypothetical protein